MRKEIRNEVEQAVTGRKRKKQSRRGVHEGKVESKEGVSSTERKRRGIRSGNENLLFPDGARRGCGGRCGQSRTIYQM